MLTLTAIEDVLGPVDPALAADIVQTGASESELREACMWLASDEPLVNDMKSMPSGRVARVIDVLREADRAFEDDR